jgi:membrane protein DedA with SNARE-associated domain
MEHLLDVNGTVVYLLVGLMVFAEDGFFLGFVLPGETAAVLGGVDASRGHVDLAAMAAVVVVAAVAGDSLGYEVGCRAGPRLMQARALRRHRERVARTQELLARRGGPAVFLGRFVAFLRATVPALAGAAHMPYPRFLGYNLAGGLVWGTGTVLLGYVAGTSYATVERAVGRVAAVAVVVGAIAGLVAWRLRAGRAGPGGRV